MDASNRFAALTSLWTKSGNSSIAECIKDNAVLHRIALTIAGSQWEDKIIVFKEVEMLTSTFSLFGDTV